MEDLPPSLIIEILNRVSDSSDLARFRVASKTINSVSHDVRYLSLFCTLPRYLKSRSPETQHLLTPFKVMFHNMLRHYRCLESVSIGVDKGLCEIPDDDAEDESDDLHLTDANFLKEWLPSIGAGLKSILISDFWVQSCWRKSEALSLISSCCHNLLKLEMRNAWLSVDGLNPMPKLIYLTLEFIRLDDEDLMKVNHCFPSLEVLNLIGVGGLKEPKVHLMQLRSCHWTVSNAPRWLTIIAPNLIQLKLKCIKPKSLFLKTPSLSDFHLTLEGADDIKVKEFPCLKRLHLECHNPFILMGMFQSSRTIKMLAVNSTKSIESTKTSGLTFETLVEKFPNLSSLELGPGVWSELETSFRSAGMEHTTGMNSLKKIVAHLVVVEVECTLEFIFSILDKCSNLSNMAFLFHHELDPSIGSKLVSSCRSHWPRVRWRWGVWKEGAENEWGSICS